MAGILPSYGNIGILAAALYPIFIVAFLFVASIFNQTFLKGVLYLCGIMITFIFCYLIALLPIGNTRDVSLPCDFISTLGYNYKSPSFQAATTWFTFTYLLIPMLQNITLFNPVVIGITSIFSIINMIYLYSRGCSSGLGLAFGAIIGILLGTTWFAMIWSTNKDLLFYNELVSNNVVCNKPSKQTFKCHVYKNGELIGENVV
jgi:hypothetical protein